MKVRVFKKSDGTVIYSYPSLKYQNLENFEGCKFPPETDGLSYIDLEDSEIPESNSQTGNYHEMIHFDGECIKENLKQDKSWEKLLMPSFLIKGKHLKNLEKNLDAELEKTSPDAIAVAKIQREHAKVKDLKHDEHEEELYAIALKNLDRAEKDTTLIKKKIKDKIKAIPAERAAREQKKIEAEAQAVIDRENLRLRKIKEKEDAIKAAQEREAEQLKFQKEQKAKAKADAAARVIELEQTQKAQAAKGQKILAARIAMLAKKEEIDNAVKAQQALNEVETIK